MQVILPDGKRLDLPDGATGADVAQAIGPGLARAARAVEVEGQLFDLLTPLPDNANVSIVTKGDDKVLHLTRHTLAHVMAQAVRVYLSEEGADPADRKMGIGPVIENGFRSEEHTSELQSRGQIVCRLLLEKKKKKCMYINI